MKLVHMVFGLAVLVVFVLTGQDMALYHGHLGGMADGPRMLYRSRHIYILLASLLNLGLGAYLTRGLDRRTQILQVVGSGQLFLRHAYLSRPSSSRHQPVIYAALRMPATVFF